ncbi:MAG: hypothetical protein Q8P66_00140 [Candidatus Colwellbacteria bacterium]|nr:hypothetical protein [Candidatus Colwellbacteria bacterium]
MILFYTSVPRSFRTTLIGHLYELASQYPVVLLSEKLDQFTEEIVKNKKLFPGLEKIIPVHQHTEEKASLLRRNRELSRLAKEVIHRYKPKAIIVANDLYLFEMYLFREAKKVGAVNIAIQAALSAFPGQSAKWITLGEAHLRLPRFLPLPLRLNLIKTRRLIGHFFYYWLLPLANFQGPFFGKSSHILLKGESGMRDASYQTVFNKREWDIYSKNGVPEKKLIILPHPLLTSKKFFDNFLSSPLQTLPREKQKVALVLLPGDIEAGFRRNLFFISNERRLNSWRALLQLAQSVLPDWKIIISTHPATKNYEFLKQELESISPKVKIMELNGPTETYLNVADVIIGLPPSLSTLLFAASLQYPKKPILSLDPNRELMGDYYKDFPGIDYVTSKITLEEKLKLIRSGKYKKQMPKLTQEGFKNTIELIQYALKEKTK